MFCIITHSCNLSNTLSCCADGDASWDEQVFPPEPQLPLVRSASGSEALMDVMREALALAEDLGYTSDA